jgi:hypothetical protein
VLRGEPAASLWFVVGIPQQPWLGSRTPTRFDGLATLQATGNFEGEVRECVARALTVEREQNI